VSLNDKNDDKEYEINVSTLKLLYENIELMDRNIKLVQEVRRLRMKVAELERVNIGNQIGNLVKDCEDCVLVVVVKGGTNPN
jgi:hypothetical protein